MISSQANKSIIDPQAINIPIKICVQKYISKTLQTHADKNDRAHLGILWQHDVQQIADDFSMNITKIAA